MRGAASLLLLLAACGGSLEPGDVAGSYTLVTVDAGFGLEGRHLLFSEAQRSDRVAAYEGELRGSGVVVLLPRHPVEPGWELELGFEGDEAGHAALTRRAESPGLSAPRRRAAAPAR